MIVSFWCFAVRLAMKMISIVSRNVESIFEPRVYFDFLGKCWTKSCQSLYALINLSRMERLALLGGGLIG